MTTEQATPATASQKNKGGRPANPPSEEMIQKVLSSEAGQAAISSAAEIASQRILEKIMVARSGVEPTAAATDGARDDDMSLVRKLALAIGEISDQGTSRKRVAPEILAKREAARLQCEDLIVQAHVKNLQPEYQVISETYLDEQLIRPFRTDAVSKKVMPTIIIWTGCPNPSLKPVNDVSIAIFNAYQEWIGGMTVMGKTHDGRSFIDDNRPRSVTPGGLVIKGELNNRRTIANLADSNAPTRVVDRVSFANPHDPTATDVHVLGTVAPAARQNHQG